MSYFNIVKTGIRSNITMRYLVTGVESLSEATASTAECTNGKYYLTGFTDFGDKGVLI